MTLVRLKTLLFSTLLLLSGVCPLRAQHKDIIDSLKQVFNQHPLGKEGVEAIRQIGWEYDGMDGLKSLEFAQQAFLLAEKINYEEGKAGCYTDMAIAYKEMGKADSAFACFNRSIALCSSLHFEKGLAGNYSNMGILYRSQGKLSEALACQLKGFRAEEKLGNEDGMANSMNAIGNIYLQQGQLDKALQSYQGTLERYTKSGNLEGQGMALNNIGLVYSDQKDQSKALDYFQRSLLIREKIGRKKAIATSNENIANCYSAMEEYTKAMVYYQKSLSILKTIGNKRGIATVTDNIAVLYTRQKKYREALNFFRQSESMALGINYKDLLREVYRSMAEVFDKLNEDKNAYEYHRKYSDMKDSIFTEKGNRELAEMSTKFQTEQKDSQIKLLNKDKEIQASELRGKTLIIWGACAGLLLLLGLSFFIFRSYRIKQRANIIISQQKEQVEQQRDIIEGKNKEILDSIHYARRIQGALLAPEALLKRHVPDHFVYYQPKDIVSGDFYWASELRTNSESEEQALFFLCTADCTGHGVPGAFMSLLGTNFLNEVVIGKKISAPDLIFGELRSSIKHVLNPEGQESKTQDGMDAVLCVYDFRQMTLRFAAANNPLWLIREGKLTEFNGDKQPIGAYLDEEKPFSLHAISLQPGDLIYTFTDGYADQFGGKKGKKFKYKSLLNLLLTLSPLPMSEQKEELRKTMDTWKGSHEQVDDILVIGVRV